MYHTLYIYGGFSCQEQTRTGLLLYINKNAKSANITPRKSKFFLKKASLHKIKFCKIWPKPQPEISDNSVMMYKVCGVTSELYELMAELWQTLREQ